MPDAAAPPLAAAPGRAEPAPRCHDVLGIGFGPANLSLAIAFEEEGHELDARFLEARPGPSWQSAMMLDGSDIQNHPVRDLVSLRNPRSRYSFINYLFENGRLLEHLNVPLEFPLRKDYARYVSWAATHFSSQVDYGTHVTGVAVERDAEDRRVYAVTTSTGQVHRGRSLVIGTGRAPYVPEPFDAVDSPRVFHLTRYLPALERLAELDVAHDGDRTPLSVVVIGGSQSAVELTLDLARRFPRATVTMLVRSLTLRLKDTSPFSEEGYFPGFTDYYYRAPRERKDAIDSYMRLTNYSSADGDVLRELYRLIYEQRLDGDQRVFVSGSRQVRSLDVREDGVHLAVEELNTGEREEHRADFVVLATGFRDLGPAAHQERVPALMREVADGFAFDEHGYLSVGQDYEVRPVESDTPALFLNGLCESSHGIGDAGSFSLLSLRAKIIADGLRKRLS
ncbi:SidA/IucD/PvdA family monooxygenase [Actinosynnema pretiosum subsp. pretiosum]|uniref:L-lysine N6-monooxygenase MbtG n=2 Tax=Actinosynnema TaxID=40566 RepID=C6WHE2_ACTMD|nr:SidA/IucD/PvdA family monooxygenase [Actinosynnema mirum]ACU38061.1 L-ornithine 5-monooxygenase oxidoreductase protein [Actinosynnema mirum DSM 43827]AXX31554.1 putative L-ORNITHINE 5-MONOOXYGENASE OXIDOREDUCTASE PROTEIN [Actinosynnema pretiosum subsp. pretiosum]QUF04415.1 SidA/IucD/PvdA family monooxygenase [Actinosynnema pretiosum subsp. pretiosum]